MPSSNSIERLSALRTSVDALSPSRGSSLPFGVEAVDSLLAGGGLPMDALCEVAPASPSLADDAAASLFVAGIAARLAVAGRQMLWALTRFDLYAPGLEQSGLSARSAIYAEVADDADVLALAEDGVRGGALAAVVAEARRAGMVATRRLQLAAAEGGAPVLLLRRWRRAGTCPLGEPSAAATRWRIGCAPSARLDAPGVGRARWHVELVRQRGGAPFSLQLDACDGQGRLALAAAARDRAPAAVRASARAA